MKKGFTLIELMVVIAIIGILTAIITANLAQSKSKSRDAKRISDIAQLQLALELFFDRCNVYPSTLATGSTNGSCPPDPVSGQQINLGNFIAQIPSDPTAGSTYLYGVNNAATPTDYVLHAQLENPSTLDRYTGTTNIYSPVTSCAGTNDYCMLPR